MVTGPRDTAGRDLCRLIHARICPRSQASRSIILYAEWSTNSDARAGKHPAFSRTTHFAGGRPADGHALGLVQALRFQRGLRAYPYLGLFRVAALEPLFGYAKFGLRVGGGAGHSAARAQRILHPPQRRCDPKFVQNAVRIVLVDIPDHLLAVQLEQETQALSKDQETLIIILTQAQIHYS